jgi:hypothetical protein
MESLNKFDNLSNNPLLFLISIIIAIPTSITPIIPQNNSFKKKWNSHIILIRMYVYNYLHQSVILANTFNLGNIAFTTQKSTSF